MSDESESTRPYTVGYGRPPIHTRFRKGESSKGQRRQKQPETLRQLIERIGRERIVVTDRGKHRRISRADLVALTTMRLAAQGDMKANADLTRLAVLMGDFDERGRNPQPAAEMIVPSTPQTPEEIEIYLIELAEHQRKYREAGRAGEPAPALPGPGAGSSGAPPGASPPVPNGQPKPER